MKKKYFLPRFNRDFLSNLCTITCIIDSVYWYFNGTIDKACFGMSVAMFCYLYNKL